ncbi:3-hydroxyacyl-CoA dehydrogenase family protein [Microbacterium sp. EYE_5]|uniref:3-hydroxyacyl-CoA dehydrogenase family protein n=1 Tax=unclassified Microbacterium TaxID=2609290 RepID=UPI0027E06AE3|nr:MULTISPECIES: 3-hydroxyacyl-CoA dehydrogenase family protein [unclassified Microbacterium]MCK6080782.1 3-hydroxyacyl-CoA dehydrogenase family protein [Microbacterium sp. EYE_382]MCK6086053.1 3-hydroxyacyl-CoA dehydrogenase family protein [Microbacterium sp. EYE_384]MCK6124449.1 3-hydroxyacyl-CoA dehydrogenase family protein [Microbacterium sp. EYE_80]MCK6127358.1 3-hydroxyacyl-CoA dehydrogenase family protein [Microbacterium sp. EYE_79]MCK6141737.1 3-hydroxyacyl-CoA dehydrogenase family pro
MTAASAGAPGVVGVIGGGRMGAGIAHAFVLAGSRVVVVERDADAADAADARIQRSLAISVDRGATTASLDDLRAFVEAVVDPTALADADLVIEAVPEDRQLKVEALRRAASAVRTDAALATNTSSISIDDLAGALERPADFIGLHFFNPVPASGLVEVVVGARTADTLREAAVGWVQALGKTPVVVRDAPGFASSRLGVALALEAIRMVEEGVADVAAIDAAMELGYRHPTGPLRTTDIVGLDVRLGIAEELAAKLGPRFEPPRLLREMVEDGRLGRKSGIGFYEWSDS